ncbi:hypothetical protein AB7282_14745 [Providencia huaxiensis]|uniref:hypothetical protein n=1 Tax=Providencia huaxiensis TaxID=2027290 RepID=UPI001E3B662A|nr:hypothetical protein [Providencia huaxiensis]MCD2526947.1 hypothetical protein [Providencia huaxiensis]
MKIDKTIPSQNQLPPIFGNKNSFSNNINAINNSGQETHFPVKEKGINKTYTIPGDNKGLHPSNQDLQANIVKSLLSEKYPDISLEMITKTQNLGADGYLEEKELQYISKNIFVVLTLLTDEEIKKSNILDCMAKLIKKVNNSSGKDTKQMVKSLKEVFEAMPFNNIWSERNIDDLSQRLFNKYVKPKAKEKLTSLLTEKTIEKFPIDKLFVNFLFNTKNELIMEAKNQLKKHKSDGSVDKHLQLDIIFSGVEQYLETMKELTVSIKTDDETENTAAPNPDKKTKPEDSVDGGNESISDDNKEAPSPPTKPITVNFNNIYNVMQGTANTNTNTNTNDKHVDPKEQQVEGNNQENGQVASQQMIDDMALDGMNKKPAIDFNVLLGIKDAAKETKPNVDPIRQEALLESRPLLVRKSNTIAQEQLNYSAPSRQETTFSPNTYQKDKNNRWVLKEQKDQKAVTLSANGALTRNLSDKAIYQGDREAVKTVVDTYSHIPNTGKPVTLTERGALTRDQSKKDAYTTPE